MEQLGAGLWRVRLGRGDGQNAFLAEGDDGLALVDSGMGAAAGRKVLEAVTSRWSAGDLKRILITHAHPDHVGGLRELREATGAAIMIHTDDAPWLRGGRVPQGAFTGIAALAASLPMMRWAPVEPDATLRGGETLGGLEVIHTPGHTPGHIVLRHVGSNSVLVGDAVFHRRSLSRGPSAFAADIDQRDRTVARIPVDVAAVGFAHGAPLVGGAVEEFAAYVAS